MKLLRLLFGPPDVAKLTAKAASTGDFSGLGNAAIHRDPAVRLQAISALASLAEALVASLHEQRMRRAIQGQMSTISSLQAESDAKGRLTEPLVQAMKDADPAVRTAAVRGLDQLHGMHATYAPLIAALHDPDARVRLAAVQAWRKERLQYGADRHYCEAVLAMGRLRDDPDTAVRTALKEQLVALQHRGLDLFKGIKDQALLELQARLREQGFLPESGGDRSSAGNVPLLPLEGTESLTELVERLITHYRRRPDGFIVGTREPAIEDIRRIGALLEQRGGFELMRQAHAEFVQRCTLAGVARNLEFMWDGIGRWQG